MNAPETTKFQKILHFQKLSFSNLDRVKHNLRYAFKIYKYLGEIATKFKF